MNRVPDRLEGMARKASQVECLGLSFESDDARRSHFRSVLAERLRDPEYRSQPGFPVAEDEDILRMSDPPYYTACPNPFLEDFTRVYGSVYDSGEQYHRDPFAVDVSVGKTDALYKAHSYHTKVPHLAIVPSILHYTEPGDIVLDGFCGSGMTGVAAQFCGSATAEYRMKVESERRENGEGSPTWGARRAILSDLSPAATFISAGYNIPFDVDEFEREANRVLDEVDAELGWMYETMHTDGRTRGRINYTVWSDVYACPECGDEVVFLHAVMDPVSKRMSSEIRCGRCEAEFTKKDAERATTLVDDSLTGCTFLEPKRVPVIINYSTGQGVFEKTPDSRDLEVIDRAGRTSCGPLPTTRMMFSSPESGKWGDKWRSGTASFRSINHLFLPRAAQSVSAVWAKATVDSGDNVNTALRYWAEQAIWGMSKLNRYKPLQHGQPGGSQVNNYISGLFYVGSAIAESSPRYVLGGKLKRLVSAFRGLGPRQESSMIGVSDCGHMTIPAETVDYIFTDPPFGANFAYAELNFVVESFHKVFTSVSEEAIVSPFQHKGVHEYQDLMTRCFAEYHRVLKPGRWMTVVFSNSSNAIWRAIQEAIASAGFVVADVRTLDKKQGSFNQVLGVTVDQDLVISAYKPSSALLVELCVGSAEGGHAWQFLAEHLSNVPVTSGTALGVEVVAERTPQMLHDRMVGFFVQRGLAVPLSTAEFMSGLSQRYPERDGMYFLSEQVAEYDRRRARVDSVRQLSLMVTDEFSAIQWVRQQLDCKPQSFPELAPVFMREAQQSWAKHEAQIELKELLEENFLLYDGRGAVPSQIKSYLSTNWREYRNLEAGDPSLQAKARDRWYVPDPGKESDLQKLRERQLLKEFEHYRASSARKLRLFRTEAVRTGFKRAYDERDWEAIVNVAGRLPDSVVQEDEKLLMYYDVARMRVG